MTPSVAIVDVYAPTLRLAQAFTAAGYEVIRVQSTPEIPPVYRPGFDPTVFDHTVIHSGDLDATLASLRAHEPTAVITGGESGVELADLLSERLGLASNGTTLSAARRSKFAMIETIRAAGLHCADQLLIPDADTLTRWHADRGGRIVVKPLRSAGNDGVHFCDTPDQSRAAYDSVVGDTNIFGIVNEGVVAQQFLVGGEYVVNTVSCRGQHRTTDMWRYTKMSANGVTDRVSGAVSVHDDDPRWQRLEQYAHRVLAALGIDYGPAHLEIMLTPSGPALVEIGARLCGADTAYYADLAAGESQIDWAVTSFTDPDRFIADHRSPHTARAHVAMAFLTSPVSGVLRGYPKLDDVRALPSFHNHHEIVRPGQHLPITVSDLTEPMMIGLAHEVADVLERDLATVNYLDGHGFYELETV